MPVGVAKMRRAELLALDQGPCRVAAGVVGGLVVGGCRGATERVGCLGDPSHAGVADTLDALVSNSLVVGTAPWAGIFVSRARVNAPEAYLAYQGAQKRCTTRGKKFKRSVSSVSAPLRVGRIRPRREG